jgi:hypothetical protein
MPRHDWARVQATGALHRLSMSDVALMPLNVQTGKTRLHRESREIHALDRSKSI